MSRTPDEMKTLMIEVVKAVEEAGVPEDLRVAAFEKTFDAMVGTGTGPPSSPVREPDRRVVPADGPSLGAIAARLGLDPELVGEIYYVDGDVLGLALASSKLKPKKAAATQEIALLLAAGRQAGGWDEWTPASRIRDVAREYGKYDQANFATTVRRMGDVFSFRRAGRDLEVRLTRPGYEQAANLARELGEM
jgi:hypothetical protein